MPISDYLRNLRRKVGSDLILIPSVMMLIYNDHGRVLLVKHIEGEMWVTPGGTLEPGESPADAAVREMWEETGLLTQPTRLVGVYGGPEFHLTYANGDQLSVVSIVFEGKVVGGEMRPDGVETLELAYFSQADLHRLTLTPWMKIVLTDAFRREPQTQFIASGWTPPPGSGYHGGMSDHMRGLREKIGPELLITPAASGVVFDDQGHILLQKRADNQRWAPPAGGIDPHEAPADAVVREVWEETGVLVEPVQVVGIYGGPEFHMTYPHGDQCAVFSFVFKCRALSGQPRPDGIESLAAQYFAPEDIPHHLLPQRWQRRLANALTERTSAYFDPPTWRRPT